ncbi:genetic competence negative regulator [Bacillus marinisedimentorum]|uniref:genetic competence negative regulator n=1 Tax=Bacillus marinisedimentorum TaxID=1821260 RepID=UPI0008727F55|nr:genetic competence negative regulator [Bacillus marinisedimentorum]
MRLERLTYNKIKIFLTFDDLTERGLTKEDLWQDIPKVHQLFREMMDEANVELGFEADGPIAVEVFALQAQGMVVIVTKGTPSAEEDEDFEDEYIEMQVTLDEKHDIFYEFAAFEDVIQLASRLLPIGIEGGRLFSYNERYYVEFHPNEVEGMFLDDFVSLLAEFGSPSTITTHRVQEYGKCLMEKTAIHDIYRYFISG